MNCGYFLPPMAGTDLPNLPCREPWQPMLGSVRTYLFTDGANDYPSFKKAMARGRVFITGGPLLRLTVDGRPIGDTIQIPEPGPVVVRAEIVSPQPLRELRLAQNGIALEATAQASLQGGIHSRTIEKKIRFDQSGWIAAWGKGAPIKAQNIDAMAHTNAIRAIVDGQPIRSQDDRTFLQRQLQERRDFYREHGTYENEAQRRRAIEIFDEAIEKLMGESID